MNKKLPQNDSHFIYQRLKFNIYLLLFLSALIAINFMEIKSRRAEIRNDIIKMLSTINSEIGVILNNRVLLVRGIIVLVAEDTEISREKFQKGSSLLIGDDPYMRNLTLIEGSIITDVYPLEGNEAALGVDILMISAQKETFLAARNSRNIVVSGPVELVQGGTGLIFRLPIIVEDSYWGQASMVIDMDRILTELEELIGQSRIPLNYAVRGKDGQGARGEFFSGKLLDVSKNADSITIPIPGGEWQILVSPKQGWILGEKSLLFFWLISLLLLLLVYWILHALKKAEMKIHKMAYNDSLTGLLNRRVLPDTFQYLSLYSQRNNVYLGFLLIDLDGFKEINDKYGHGTGDSFLIEFTVALKENTRGTDLIFRLGGDEFLILYPDLKSQKAGEIIAEKMRNKMETLHKVENYQFSFNFSMGLSFFPEEGNELETLLGLSDQRMYKNKKERKTSR